MQSCYCEAGLRVQTRGRRGERVGEEEGEAPDRECQRQEPGCPGTSEFLFPVTSWDPTIFLILESMIQHRREQRFGGFFFCKEKLY